MTNQISNMCLAMRIWEEINKEIELDAVNVEEHQKIFLLPNLISIIGLIHDNAAELIGRDECDLISFVFLAVAA